MRSFLEETLAEPYGPAWYFLATTGARRGEAVGLRWADVTLDAGKVTIQRARIAVAHHASYGATKTGRARVVELDKRTVAVLRQQRKRQAEHRLLIGAGYGDEDLVFCHPDGRPYHPERFSREFDRRQERYNRRHHDELLPRLLLRDLRHTWATLASFRAGEHPRS